MDGRVNAICILIFIGWAVYQANTRLVNDEPVTYEEYYNQELYIDCVEAITRKYLNRHSPMTPISEESLKHGDGGRKLVTDDLLGNPSFVRHWTHIIENCARNRLTKGLDRNDYCEDLKVTVEQDWKPAIIPVRTEEGLRLDMVYEPSYEGHVLCVKSRFRLNSYFLIVPIILLAIASTFHFSTDE